MNAADVLLPSLDAMRSIAHRVKKRTARVPIAARGAIESAFSVPAVFGGRFAAVSLRSKNRRWRDKAAASFCAEGSRGFFIGKDEFVRFDGAARRARDEIGRSA